MLQSFQISKHFIINIDLFEYTCRITSIQPATATTSAGENAVPPACTSTKPVPAATCDLRRPHCALSQNQLKVKKTFPGSVESAGALRHGRARRGSLAAAPNITCDILSPRSALCTGRLRRIHWHRLKYTACWGYRWRGRKRRPWRESRYFRRATFTTFKAKLRLSCASQTNLSLHCCCSCFFNFSCANGKPPVLLRPRSCNSLRGV